MDEISKNAFDALQEANQKLDAAYNAVRTLSDLSELGNLKYLTRDQRETLYKNVLTMIDAVDDAAKAGIKHARSIRRARMRDDDHIGRYIMSMGIPVDDYIDDKIENAEDEDVSQTEQ